MNPLDAWLIVELLQLHRNKDFVSSPKPGPQSARRAFWGGGILYIFGLEGIHGIL